MNKFKIFGVGTLMLLISAVPAMATTFEFEQEAESGDVYQVYESATYGNGNAVATDADFNANTGNYQNQQSYYAAGNVQYDN